MILPIAIAFSIGIVMRKKNLMDNNGSAAIKTIVSKFLLPVILLNAFMFANYSKDSMAIIIVFFLAMLAQLGIGFLLRRFIPERAKYFLLTIHHVCFDGTSYNIFFDDAAKFYAAPTAKADNKIEADFCNFLARTCRVAKS